MGPLMARLMRFNREKTSTRRGFHARSRKPANKAAHTGYSLFYSAPDLAVATKEC